ncbi:S-layer homology domain-containing protein [Bacillus sp. FJAT-45350]|uniref:S-layer homology domain-containing protein n=1 Tax=Bacillus sp. FJAT-45350 TaxID=2011014 RepID=UPI000BB932BB|nr:S-layer homology domain-containing protein [Bacillus sp. FJAT-45350]
MAYQPKSYRKFLATSLSAAMVATVAAPLAVPTTTEAASKFPDVASNAYYADAVEYLVNKGVIEGMPNGTFAPNEGVTRAQAAKMLAEALELEVSTTATLGFSDTKNDAWYAPYVAALVEEGIIEGLPDGTFAPNATITRAQLAKMVVEAYELEQDATAIIPFTDTVAGAWYEDYVNTLFSLGVVNGMTDTTFAPGATVTRAQSAVFLHRTLEPTERVDVPRDEPVYTSPTIVSVDAAVNANKTVLVTGDAALLDEVTVEIFEVDVEEALVTAEVEVQNDSFEFTSEELANGNYVVVVSAEDVDAVEVEFSVTDVTAAPGTITFENQPQTTTLAFGAPLNEVFKFQVTAGNDDITLRSIQLNQYGTARTTTQDIVNIHLMVDGEIVTSGTINTHSQVRLNRQVTVPKNSTLEFVVLADINSTAGATRTVQFGLDSVNGINANANINGSFPAIGNSFSLIAGNVGSLSLTQNTTPRTVEVGKEQETIGQFSLQPVDEAVEVRSVTLTARDLDTDKFANYYLYNNRTGERIDVEGIIRSNDKVVFNLANNPIKVDRNQSFQFQLKADPTDVTGGNPNSRFEIQNSYDIIAKGLNSGFNNNTTVTSPIQLSGQITVNAGLPELLISTKSPRANDTIVATSSEAGVVREYNFVTKGEDLELRNVSFHVNAQDALQNPVALNQIREVQLIDKNSGSVVANVTNLTGTGANTFTVNNINWLFDRAKTSELQTRVILADSSTVRYVDVRLGELTYRLTDTRTDNTIHNGGLPTSAQFKQVAAEGTVKISDDGGQIKGYSLSSGLSEASLGGFTFKPENENVDLRKVYINASALGSGTALNNVLANPVLKVEDTVVGYGTFNGNQIRFDLSTAYQLEKNEEVELQLYADVLDSPSVTTADVLNLNLTSYETRSSTTGNIVPVTGLTQSLTEETSTSGVYETFNFRDTSVVVDVSNEAVDTSWGTSRTLLRFTVDNLASVETNEKRATLEQVQFKNLFNFTAAATSNDVLTFVVRRNNLNPVTSGTSVFSTDANGNHVITATGGSRVVGGTKSETFLLNADLSEAGFEGTRMRLDAVRGNWIIRDNSGNVITPLFKNDKGPDIRIN